MQTASTSGQPLRNHTQHRKYLPAAAAQQEALSPGVSLELQALHALHEMQALEKLQRLGAIPALGKALIQYFEDMRVHVVTCQALDSISREGPARSRAV